MSLYLLGNAFGPLFWAPVSEAYGRKVSILFPLFGLMIFSFASATAKDVQTLMISRFFGGVFGGAPFSNVGGVLADIWPATKRGGALIIWGLSVMTGPLIAPVIDGALAISLPTTGWRWTGYLTGIMVATILVASMIWVDESYAPVLLARKANHLRFQTKDWALHSKSEESSTSTKAMARKYLLVPLEMLVDPIAFFINLYAAFCYAIIYLAITSFPIEFQMVRGWNEVVESLPFLSILVGVFLAAFINYVGSGVLQKALHRERQQDHTRSPASTHDDRVFFLPSWLVHYGLDCKSIYSLDRVRCWRYLGFFVIFQSAVNYLVDTYLMLAASALAANVFMRSILAAAFPLVAHALFTNLGLDWGMSLIGFIAVAMIPFPFLFYIFGQRIRGIGKRSKESIAF